MEPWLIWTIAGGALILLELVVPGAVTIFVGLSAMVVGLCLKLGLIQSLLASLITWFILSILLLLFVRTIFVKHFEGDSRVQDVDEDKDAVGSLVDVTEDIEPHREGRISFRGASWQARSEEALIKGTKAIILSREDKTWIVKSI